MSVVDEYELVRGDGRAYTIAFVDYATRETGTYYTSCEFRALSMMALATQVMGCDEIQCRWYDGYQMYDQTVVPRTKTLLDEQHGGIEATH